MDVIPKGNPEITTTQRFVIHSGELREWLLEYDAMYQSYPEHQYEGLSVWKFLEIKMEGKNPEYVSRLKEEEWLIWSDEIKSKYRFPY